MCNPDMDEEEQSFDHLISCIYDVRQELLTPALQALGPDELADELGCHWGEYSFRDLTQSGTVTPGDPYATLSPDAAQLLLLTTGIGPLPRRDSVKQAMDLVSQVQSAIGPEASPYGGHGAKFRVLPIGDFQPDAPVAVEHTCLGHPGPNEVRELAELGLKFLSMGNYAVAFAPQDAFSSTALYIYDKPGKAPRTDIDVEKAVRVLQGIEKL